MTEYVLDTNIVSLIVKRDKPVKLRFDKFLTSPNRFLACPVVWYEARRGLLANDARRQMRQLFQLFQLFEWQEFTRADWELAAQLWAQRKATGRPIADADLLIAVFALNRNAVLVTDNEKDFDGLSVNVENWKQP